MAEADHRQRTAEDALRESEYRYRNLFQAMAASFWELDFTPVGGMLRDLRKQGVGDFAAYFAEHPAFVRRMMQATRVIDVNDQTVALFGDGDKSALFQTLDVYWPEESSQVYADSVIAAVSGKPSFAAETRLRKLNGEIFDALFTACFAPESVADGKLLIGVIDTSERVRAQAMLRQLQAEFAHAARVSMLGELTASIAHEVNQPLAAIATNASAGLRWLDRAEPDIAEVRALTARIIADAQRAAEVIARIRAMASRNAAQSAPISVNSVVEEAMLFLAHELQGHEVSLTLALGKDLPAVMADRIQLQQVVVNLAVNAIQAMTQTPPQKRRLTIRTRLSGAQVCATVEDAGPGIGDARKERLFESFFTTKSDGMGMGLPICRSIVESYGGAIDAANGEAGGAVFTVALPAAR
ncbi:MAG: ATP-binding protein [Hyphomonadaceae bacterium]|nr:ATP-binding protein [Hyphomonadaceae bacterium]